MVSILTNNDDNHLPLVLTKSGFANALGTNVNIGFQSAQRALKENISKMLGVIDSGYWNYGWVFFLNVFVL